MGNVCEEIDLMLQKAAETQKTSFIDLGEYEGQRSEERHKKRAGKFTGSRIKELMTSGKGNKIWGDTAKKYIFEKYVERKTGKAFSDPNMKTYAMQRGIEMEPVAKSVYFERYGVEIKECDFIQSPLGIALGASPDGVSGNVTFVYGSFEQPESFINEDGKMVYEAKCRNGMAHFAHGCEVVCESHPDFWQIMCEIHVTGAKKAIYINYNPDFAPLDLIVQEVEPSPIHIGKMLDRVQEAENHLSVMAEMGVKEAYNYVISIN
jgi:hypothetical protein